MLSAYLRKPWASGKHAAALVPLLAFVCALIAPDRDRAADAKKPETGAGPAGWVGDLSPIGAADWNRARAAHLLERAGFGGTPEEIDRLAKMTPQEAVDYLVDYDKLKDNLPPFDESGIYRQERQRENAPGPSKEGTGTVLVRVENNVGVPIRSVEFFIDKQARDKYTEDLGPWLKMRDKDGMYRLNDVPLGKISLFVKKGEGVHPQNGNLYTNQVRTVHLTEPGQVYSLMVMGTKDMKPTAFRVANEKKAQGKGNKRPDWFESYRLAQWWAERMLRTSRPLEEKMAFFWHGHFAVSNEKIADYRKMKLHIDTLRLHAAGNFRDLLTAVSKDPAMLVWLDANNNTKDGPNENFAREIMELFALGLDNYTEDDIREAARAFTGWSWEGLRFVFRPELHDNTIKTILGKRGYFGGDDVINILLDDSQCARFLVRKLHKFFVREEMSPTLQARLAQVLRNNKYELKPLLRTMFLSKDFYSPASTGQLIKSPVEFVVSTYKKLGLDTIPGIPDFRESTIALGQQLLFPPDVAGWDGDKDGGKSWINPGMFLNRGNVAHAVLFPADPRTYFPPDRRIPPAYVGSADFDSIKAEFDVAYARVKVVPRATPKFSLVEMLRKADIKTADGAVDYLVRRFLVVPMQEKDRQSLIDFLHEQAGGNDLDLTDPADGGLSSTEKALRYTLHLIMSSPEYSLE